MLNGSRLVLVDDGKERAVGVDPSVYPRRAGPNELRVLCGGHGRVFPIGEMLEETVGLFRFRSIDGRVIKVTALGLSDLAELSQGRSMAAELQYQLRAGAP